MTTSPSSPRPTNLVVIHLAGGNDALNTVVPYDDPRYHDARPTLALRPDLDLPVLQRPGRDDLSGGAAVLPIESGLGLHGALGGLARLYRERRLAVLLGIGYPDRDRSHFRSLDVWHTAEPHAKRNDGWLGRTATRLDPAHDNPVLLTNIGRALPLAMSAPGVMAASLETVASYGLFPDRSSRAEPRLANLAAELYRRRSLPDPWRGTQLVGRSAMQGIDAFSAVADDARAESPYPRFNPLAERLATIARIIDADIGARIFHTAHDGYDTHERQMPTHHRLLADLAEAVTVFLDDLTRRGRDEETIVLIHSEFGRRIAESRGGTDHGGAGVAFLVGTRVHGGVYGQQPSLRPADTIDGDLAVSIDLRELYTAILEQFLDVDAEAVLGRAHGNVQLVREAA